MSLAFLSGIYSKGEVVGEKPEVSKSFAVVNNGKHVFRPPYGKTFSKVEVTVAVEDGDIKPSEGLYFVEDSAVTVVLNSMGTCNDKVVTVPSVDDESGRPVVGLQFFTATEVTALVLPDVITSIQSVGILCASELKCIKFGRYFRSCGAGQYADTVTGPLPEEVVLDFSNYARSEPPALSDASLLTGVIEVKVPGSMVDAWKIATNWSTVADKIVGV